MCSYESEPASSALLATISLGYKQGAGLPKQQKELKTLLQTLLAQTFVLHEQASSPFLAHIILRLTKQGKWYRWKDRSPHLAENQCPPLHPHEYTATQN